MDPTSWRRAKDVISEALKRHPSERERYVRSHCDDAALADELVSILMVDGEPAAADAADTAAYDPGTRIGPYIVLDRLGRGGMGEVFLGSDPRLQRKVALKCVIRSLAGAGEERQRILHEARAAARVNHPNVATIHDILEVEDRAFIVMEYVEGESLAARLKRERLPVAAIVDIGRQLASALAAAHAKGVVHRDLKPANIQLTPDGHAKVLDFGIANAPRVTASSSAVTGGPQALHTTVRVGQPGTPPYMSPEQLLGRAVDERSDIFSLGVVLFEMATGRRPFRGDDHLTLIVEQANGAPRADAADPRVPRPLADVIAKMLHVEAAERFESAGQVGTALAAISREIESRAEPLSRKIARGLVAAVGLLAAIELLGVVRTVGFNVNFGRIGPFARFGVESWTEYFRWGLLGIAPKLLIMTAVGLTALLVRFVFRLLERVPPVGRSTRRLRGSGRRLAAQLDLGDPTTAAQVLATAGIVAVLVFARYQIDVLNASLSSFNSAPIAVFMPIREAASARGLYQIELTVLTFVLAVGLYTVWQARRRRAIRDGRWALVALAAVVGLTILMNELPFRSLNYRDFERVDYAGSRCYITGETGGELLILCPAADPPRNRAVRRDDPQLHRMGIIENVFRGVNAPLSR